MKNTERDKDIGCLYEAGSTVEQLGIRFNISSKWVRQILKKQHKFIKNRHVVYSDREKFLGVNLSAPVKEALRKEAEKLGVSMSAFTAEMLEAMLTDLGYTVENNEVIDVKS